MPFAITSSRPALASTNGAPLRLARSLSLLTILPPMIPAEHEDDERAFHRAIIQGLADDAAARVMSTEVPEMLVTSIGAMHGWP